jgi:formylmethanofuran--tetrahydromethanopterin N-formyltransferase
MKLNGVEIEEESFAEMIPTWVGRVVITAMNQKWASEAAQDAIAFATTTIQCPVEAGVEKNLPPSATPGKRPGVIVRFHHPDWRKLKGPILSPL